MIQGVDHITINVDHLDESLSFYRNVLQLTPLPTVDMGDHKLYYFAVSDSVRLELITYEAPLATQHPAVETPGLYRHFALRTDDIAAVYERCNAHHVTVLSSPSWVDRLQFTGMLLQDPNGVEIEIVQRSQAN